MTDGTFEDKAGRTKRAATVAGRAGTWLRRLVRLAGRWARRRRQRLGLASLSDWQLRDLGLSREAAMEEAQKPFWR